MIKPIKLFIILLFSLLNFAVFANTSSSSTITVGIEDDDNESSVPLSAWQPIVDVIENVLNKKVIIHECSCGNELLVALTEKKIPIVLTSTSKMEKYRLLSQKNIKRLGTIFTKDPISGTVNPTHSRVIIVLKNSPINAITDLENKKIAYYNIWSENNYSSIVYDLKMKGVQANWVEVSSANEALNKIIQQKVDAVGLWDYIFEKSPIKFQFKIIDIMYNIPNQEVYINTDLISPEEQKELKQQLHHVKGPYGIVGIR